MWPDLRLQGTDLCPGRQFTQLVLADQLLAFKLLADDALVLRRQLQSGCLNQSELAAHVGAAIDSRSQGKPHRLGTRYFENGYGVGTRHHIELRPMRFQFLRQVLRNPVAKLFTAEEASDRR